VAEFEFAGQGAYDIPEDAYHLDPVPGGSLSYSGAKKLLAEGGPELFAYEREHPPPSTKDMELGTAAHKVVFGVGQEIAEIKADNWRGKKAGDDADKARADGKLPLLTKELAVVNAMAARLREHEWASKLLSRERGGRPEVSGFWVDDGIWWRCRWDFMPHPDPRRRPVIADYKTTADASPAEFAKTMAKYRYYLQAERYSAGYAAIFGVHPLYAIVAQERTPPYRVAVYELHPDALRKGHEDARRAMAIYRECSETGVWPGYDPAPRVLDLPYWAYRNEDY
jgi:hypothetical protein